MENQKKIAYQFRSHHDVIHEIKSNLLSGFFTDIIPFVGAGSSFPLNLPSWKNLVKDYFVAVECKLDFDELRRDFNENWPEIAEEIYKNTGSNIDAYKKFMNARFHPDSCRFTDIHLTIIENYKLIITTNYDTAFEDALNKKLKDPGYTQKTLDDYKYTTLVYPDNLTPIKFHNRCLAYLHGRRDSDSYVFREAEYKLAYGSGNIIATFMKVVIKEYPIIFLGFSFDDLVFRRTLETIIKEEERSDKEIREVHGEREGRKSIPGLYVMLQEDHINEYLSEVEFEHFFEGINIEKLPFTLDKISENEWKFSHQSNIDEIITGLNTLMDTELRKEFHDWMIKNNLTKQRNDYFRNLNIEIIKYPKHAQVSALLEEIVLRTAEFEQDINKLPDTI
ncbi:SIR2 family protein [Fluviicola sp.]|uniref:SIR2 family protein n=1 Tax=Fluviicola sp. TaxID=1917219 RepID=UPI003D29D06B